MTRRTTSRLRRVSAAAFFAAALTLFGGVAAAKTTPTTQPSHIVNSWALAPTGTRASEPSSRVFLSYDVAPGTVLHDSVTLWNYSNVQLTFHLYPTDAFNNNQGAFTLLTADQKPTDVGSWISLKTDNVTAAPNTKVDIPLSIIVPKDAHPGDHAGAVLASNQVTATGADGKAVTLDRRTGTRVYLRVTGAVHRALVVDAIHTTYHGSLNPFGGRLDVAYSVRNVGNVRVSGTQVLKASGPFGLFAKTRRPADIPELLPGNAIVLHQQFDGMPALWRDGVKITVRSTSRGAATSAVPWSIVLLALVALGARRYVVRRVPAAQPAPAV